MKDCPQNKITPWDIKTLEALPGQLQIACIFSSGPSVIPCNYKQYSDMVIKWILMTTFLFTKTSTCFNITVPANYSFLQGQPSQVISSGVSLPASFKLGSLLSQGDR